MDLSIAEIFRHRSVADFVRTESGGHRGEIEFETPRIRREKDLAAWRDESRDPT